MSGDGGPSFPLQEHLGFTIERGHGRAVASVRLGERHLNPNGVAHGAVAFTLMDTAYAKLDLPFRPALFVVGTVVSVNPRDGFAVADVGLKALGMDHGDPRVDDATVWFCSDEHITFAPRPGTAFADWGVRVGDRVRVWPAHIDPTVSQHEVLHVVDPEPSGTVAIDAAVQDEWAVDLRNW